MKVLFDVKANPPKCVLFYRDPARDKFVADVIDYTTVPRAFISPVLGQLWERDFIWLVGLLKKMDS